MGTNRPETHPVRPDARAHASQTNLGEADPCIFGEVPGLPSLPAEGVIETYEVSDALGTLRLANGEQLRFGRSACTFDPAVGDRVRVMSAAIGPLGRARATRIDAVGPRELTLSERAVIISEILLRPIEHCSDWYLALTLTTPRAPATAPAAELIRDELVTRRGLDSALVDEMIELARWADGVLGNYVIASASAVSKAIDEAEHRGLITADEAQLRRARVRELPQ